MFEYAREQRRAPAPRKPPFAIEVIEQHDSILQVAKPVTRAQLSQDQADVYDGILDWLNANASSQHLTVGGYAGTGKTTLLGCFAHELEEMGTVAAFGTFTGKAATVLNRKLRSQGLHSACGTLHSMLYIPITDPKTGKVKEWMKRPELEADIIIVDEASMISEDLWNDLTSYGIPILAVGDHGQLPPVGKGINLMARPDLRLEKIHRQAEGNPIIAFAHHVREGRDPKRFRTTDPRVRFVPTFMSVVEDVVRDPENTVALSFTNVTRVKLNRAIRAARGFDGPDPDPTDIVVALKNAPPVFNGLRGTLDSLEGDMDEYGRVEAAISFPDDGFRIRGRINVHQFNVEKTFDDLTKIPGQPGSWPKVGLLFDYGYAMTCHKAQGSSFQNVVVCVEWIRDEDVRRRWLYTAATRAVENLTVVLR